MGGGWQPLGRKKPVTSSFKRVQWESSTPANAAERGILDGTKTFRSWELGRRREGGCLRTWCWQWRCYRAAGSPGRKDSWVRDKEQSGAAWKGRRPLEHTSVSESLRSAGDLPKSVPPAVAPDTPLRRTRGAEGGRLSCCPTAQWGGDTSVTTSVLQPHVPFQNLICSLPAGFPVAQNPRRQGISGKCGSSVWTYDGTEWERPSTSLKIWIPDDSETKTLFIYLTGSEQAQAGTGGAAGRGEGVEGFLLSREHTMGLDLRTLGSRPERKTDA